MRPEFFWPPHVMEASSGRPISTPTPCGESASHGEEGVSMQEQDHSVFVFCENDIEHLNNITGFALFLAQKLLFQTEQ